MSEPVGLTPVAQVKRPVHFHSHYTVCCHHLAYAAFLLEKAVAFHYYEGSALGTPPGPKSPVSMRQTCNGARASSMFAHDNKKTALGIQTSYSWGRVQVHHHEKDFSIPTACFF